FIARCVLSGVPVYHTKQIHESLTGRVDIEHLSENSLGSLEPSSLYAKVKRCTDIVLSLIVLPFFLPALAIVGLLIKLDSPGTVFFRQPRMGYRGRIFSIWKLRTMSAERSGEAFTEGADPRITRVGHFLRKYRIDELPQIINILKGEMSWI